jgi:hypothetical protein
MKLHPPLREVVRVLMHLPGGYTRVSVVASEGSGHADGGVHWDLPTDAFPPHLRAINALAVAVVPCVTVEGGDADDDIRWALRRVEVHAVPAGGVG